MEAMGLGGIGTMGRKGRPGCCRPRIYEDCGPKRSGVWGLLLSRPGATGLEAMASLREQVRK